MDYRKALRLVQLHVLLRVELVVDRVAPRGVVRVVREVVRLVRDLLAEEVGELRIRVDERRPAPDEHVVVALADLDGELGVVEHRHLGPDPDQLQPRRHEVGDRLRNLGLRADEVAQDDVGAAVRQVADPVLVRVLVAGGIE